MYKYLEYRVEYEPIEINAEASVELKLPIPSGTYYLNGIVEIGYEELDDDYDYWLTGISADICTEDGDDIVKLVIPEPKKLSDVTKKIFSNFLEQIEVQDRIYCEEIESW